MLQVTCYKLQEITTMSNKPQQIKTGVQKDELPKEEMKSQKETKVKPAIQKKSKRSQRYQNIFSLIDKNKVYPILEAIEVAKKTANVKFNAAVETHFRLGIDVKKGEQQVRGTVALPNGTGKKVIVAAFVTDDKADEAREAGAEIVGGTELIEKIKQTQKIEFDIAITTPNMMSKLAGIAKILGPKGLMPSPKNETITTTLKKTIEQLHKGKINFKNDDTGNVHASIGNANLESNKLLENYNALYLAIKKAKPPSAKGIYIKNISLNATMGPSIKILL